MQENKKDWALAPHIYEKGFLNLCKHCKKSMSDKIHSSQIEQAGQNISEVKREIAHFHKCVLCGREHYCEVIDCKILDKFMCECKDIPGNLLNHAINNGEGPVKCIGHSCPSCKKQVIHDYECKKPANLEILCESCSSQASIESHRNELLNDIKSNGELTNQERAEIRLTHESRVNLMIRNTDGSLKDDWNEILTVHINGLRKIQEQIRIHEQVSHKAKIQAGHEEYKNDVAKLSPEEKAQYDRDAKKFKEKRKQKSQPEKIDQKKVYDNAVNMMVQSLMASNPKISKLAAKQQAEKMFKRPEEMGT